MRASATSSFPTLHLSLRPTFHITEVKISASSVYKKLNTAMLTPMIDRQELESLNSDACVPHLLASAYSRPWDAELRFRPRTTNKYAVQGKAKRKSRRAARSFHQWEQRYQRHTCKGSYLFLKFMQNKSPCTEKRRD